VTPSHPAPAPLPLREDTARETVQAGEQPGGNRGEDRRRRSRRGSALRDGEVAPAGSEQACAVATTRMTRAQVFTWALIAAWFSPQGWPSQSAQIAEV